MRGYRGVAIEASKTLRLTLKEELKSETGAPRGSPLIEVSSPTLQGLNLKQSMLS